MQEVMDYEMEEQEEDQPGFFSRLAAKLKGREYDYEEEEAIERRPRRVSGHNARQAPVRDYRARVTVRKDVSSFDEAYAAATDFRNGEIQVINLSVTDDRLRQKIVDFLSGVNFSLDGSWEEVGDDIYVLAPSHTYVDVAPGSPRTYAVRN